MITTANLINTLAELKSNGSEIVTNSQEIDMVTGLLAALDMEIEQEIYELGKELPNEPARNLFRHKRRIESDLYQEKSQELAALKITKSMLYNEREQLKQFLEIGKLEIRKYCGETEANNLDGGIRLKTG
jgi:hypothetical protein